jgi:hypothetical protein
METNKKFKVGDKVRVKSLDWFNGNKDENGLVYIDKEGIVFNETMANLCGKIVQIEEVNRTGYFIKEYAGFWQDWMLEDEPVTETQEVKQIDKNNMETKEMTLQEAQEIVRNTKYIVYSEEESRQLQEKLIEIGCSWNSSGINICNLTIPFLLVNEDLHITYLSKQNYSMFELSERKYMLTDAITCIELKQPKEEPKPKFDPKTMKPYDRVLVRDSKHEMWVARFFDYCVCGFYYTTSSACSWKYCVPYCDETKHLHHTILEAPEFYRE